MFGATFQKLTSTCTEKNGHTNDDAIWLKLIKDVQEIPKLVLPALNTPDGINMAQSDADQPRKLAESLCYLSNKVGRTFEKTTSQMNRKRETSFRGKYK